MTRMAGIYATNFTHAEVRALLAFERRLREEKLFK
jgi:hypothetical protein